MESTRYFYPRSPCGERRFHAADISARRISIHALLAESDWDVIAVMTDAQSISIHALLAESDKMDAIKLADSVLFLSTLSLRRATWIHHEPPAASTISIHALLAESDTSSTVIVILRKRFLSTLSLRRATATRNDQEASNQFLSTLSLRRATLNQQCKHHPNREFLSTLSLRRATA